MKIERVILNHLRMELQSPFETSFGRIHTRDCILLEVFSDGLVGYGECVADRDPGYSYETVDTAWLILSNFIIPSLLHKNVDGPADFQSKVTTIRGHLMAKAGFEMALWDLIGKMESVSFQKLIGGGSSKVAVGVSVGIQPSKETLVEKVADYIDQGYQRIKIKIKPTRDVADTTAVREAYPEIKLQVDANSAYTLENAHQLLPLDDLDLLLIEQPLAEDDIYDHSLIQKDFRTPLCLDESIHSVRHARQAIDMDACKIINIKAGRVGGLSQAAAIHDLCQRHNIPVWCGGMLETGVGRAANLALSSLPGFLLPGDISASDRYYKTDITEQQFTLNTDSTITVPNGIGLGITINQPELKKVTLRSLKME